MRLFERNRCGATVKIGAHAPVRPLYDPCSRQRKRHWRATTKGVLGVDRPFAPPLVQNPVGVGQGSVIAFRRGRADPCFGPYAISFFGMPKRRSRSLPRDEPARQVRRTRRLALPAVFGPWNSALACLSSSSRTSRPISYRLGSSPWLMRSARSTRAVFVCIDTATPSIPVQSAVGAASDVQVRGLRLVAVQPRVDGDRFAQLERVVFLFLRLVPAEWRFLDLGLGA